MLPCTVVFMLVLGRCDPAHDPWEGTVRGFEHWCEHLRLPMFVNGAERTLVVAPADALHPGAVGRWFCEQQAHEVSEAPPPRCVEAIASSIRLHAAVLARAAGCALTLPPSWWWASG